MIELKAISGHEIREDIDYNTRGIDPEDKEWCKYGKELCDTLYYRKSEADKVIEDIVKGAISMFRESRCCRGLDTKSPLGRIADVAFKHWNGVERTMSDNRQLRLDKANLLRSNEYLRGELNTQKIARQNDEIEHNLNIRRHKYKRCLAMARWCNDRWADIATQYVKSVWYRKWQLRWLELAEKFKEV